MFEYLNSDSMAAKNLAWYYACVSLWRPLWLRRTRPAGSLVPEEHPYLSQHPQAYRF